MPLLEPLDEPQLRSLCRAAIEQGEIRFTRHARERMVERGLDEADIVNVLRGGFAGDIGHENGSWRYELRTPRISVILVARSETSLTVITAWRSEP